MIRGGGKAITRRLLYTVGKLTRHAGHRSLTSAHRDRGWVQRIVSSLNLFFKTLRANPAQLPAGNPVAIDSAPGTGGLLPRHHAHAAPAAGADPCVPAGFRVNKRSFLVMTGNRGHSSFCSSTV